MSIPLTVTGTVYNYPVNFDTDWGIDATGWAQAVTNGMLQKSGGTFALTADVNFGATFGLLSKYFASRSTNPATVGTVRLASADPGIGFRKNLNNGDLILTTDSSDNLLYNGNIIGSPSSGTIPVSRGGTGDTSLTAYAVLCGGTASTNPVQSVVGLGSTGQALTSQGAGALPTWTNIAGSGTVNSGTATHLAYYATTSAAVSDASGHIISGTYDFSGGVTFDSGSTLSLASGSNPLSIFPRIIFQNATVDAIQLSNQLVGVGSISLLSDTTGAATVNYTVPNVGVNAKFVMTEGAQIINGTKTLGNDINVHNIVPTSTDTYELGDTSHAFLIACIDEILLKQPGNGQVDIKPNASQSTYSFTFPATQGAANTTLLNDGSGNMSWSAITNVHASGSTGISTISGSDVVQTSVTITTTGGKVLLQGSFSAGSSASAGTMEVWITRGSTAITGNRAAAAYTNGTVYSSASVICVDTPAAGTYTYNLNYNMGPTVTVRGYSLVATELKA